MTLIDSKIDKIKDACNKYRILELYAFGSVLTDAFHDKSDIDLIVNIDDSDPFIYGETYFDFKFELENLLGRKIDLLEQNAIKNKRFQNLINQKKQLLYARRSESLA